MSHNLASTSMPTPFPPDTSQQASGTQSTSNRACCIAPQATQPLLTSGGGTNTPGSVSQSVSNLSFHLVWFSCSTHHLVGDFCHLCLLLCLFSKGQPFVIRTPSPPCRTPQSLSTARSCSHGAGITLASSAAGALQGFRGRPTFLQTAHYGLSQGMNAWQVTSWKLLFLPNLHSASCLLPNSSKLTRHFEHESRLASGTHRPICLLQQVPDLCS